MNEVIKAIKERRSVRKYKADMPSKELIDAVIEAGLYAPSGMGTQKVITVAVTDKALRDKLAQDNRKIGGWKDEGFDPFYGAPVVLAVLYQKDSPTGVYDGTLVMENMMLAAHSLGLATCFIFRAKEEFEMDEYKDVLKNLGVDGEYEGAGFCILGYADGEIPEAAARKEGRVFYA